MTPSRFGLPRRGLLALAAACTFAAPALAQKTIEWRYGHMNPPGSAAGMQAQWLAEEIAMLNSMTRGTLHLGIGRGTAKMEYDAYNIDMNEARARFTECYRIVEKGLRGEPFTHEGPFWNITQPIRIRPEPVAKKVHFYGAIGSGICYLYRSLRVLEDTDQ